MFMLQNQRRLSVERSLSKENEVNRRSPGFLLLLTRVRPSNWGQICIPNGCDLSHPILWTTMSSPSSPWMTTSTVGWISSCPLKTSRCRPSRLPISLISQDRAYRHPHPCSDRAHSTCNNRCRIPTIPRQRQRHLQQLVHRPSPTLIPSLTLALLIAWPLALVPNQLPRHPLVKWISLELSLTLTLPLPQSLALTLNQASGHPLATWIRMLGEGGAHAPGW
jgi:hypothetical protein